MYKKIQGMVDGQSLPTFRPYPNFASTEPLELPWNYHNGHKSEPRPYRFLYTEKTNPDQAERKYLGGEMQRRDMDLFIRLVGLENVRKYFGWRAFDIRRVIDGNLQFEDLVDRNHYVW